MENLHYFLEPVHLAEGFLEGMKKEEHMILVPSDLHDRCKGPGRDIHRLNEFMRQSLL